ncbi:DUF1254 domain-containing protein [Caballeronia sp. LZ016]|uniref:DUF1254 domain-containing protein n=1 Tax=Caballeronia sp. LZ016 TaxID=3038554 RepID=UPI00286D2AF9|nr:DUF1254 domain-containing protein [Caballeronia sp. LZ016]
MLVRIIFMRPAKASLRQDVETAGRRKVINAISNEGQHENSCTCCLYIAFISIGAPALAKDTVPVTVDNFVRAETDMYFNNSVQGGGFGGWHHVRELLPIDRQSVIRGNRDTLYSTRVFDLDAGPVTVTLPDAGARFMSLQIISEDQYTTTEYGAGPHTLDKAKVGTRYVLAGVRTLIDPNQPGDLERVHALQDAIEVSQPGGPENSKFPIGTRLARRRFAMLCWSSPARSRIPSVHSERKRSRSRSISDRCSIGMGSELAARRNLPQRRSGKKRRQDGVLAQAEGRACRRLLVDQHL